MGGQRADSVYGIITAVSMGIIGEFYGLYGMVGRFSAITGPVLWAATTYVTVERGGLAELTGQAWAILTLPAMIVASFVILRRVTDEKRDWDALRA